MAKSDPRKISPWMAEVSNEFERSYFIMLEQEVLCYTSSFSNALFLWVSSYYIFNLDYEKNTKEVLLCLQEYVFGQPEQFKKSSTCLFQLTLRE